MDNQDNSKIYRVIGGIFISSIDPLLQADHEVLSKTYGITHILTVMKQALPDHYKANYTTMQIPIDDSPNEVLFTYFKQSNDFISSALFGNTFDELISDSENKDDALQQIKRTKHQGKILIHCSAGQSRSASFLIAFLMKFYQMNYKTAKYAISRSKPDIQPNESFKSQLLLYKKLDCEDDPKKLDMNAEYKQFLREMQFSQISGSSVEDNIKSFLSDSSNFKDEHNSGALNTNEPVYELRCKRCRQMLAKSNCFVNHDPPPEEPTEDGSEGYRNPANKQLYFTKNAFKSRRVISRERASNTCTHYFVEPLTWMKDELSKGEMEGKFNCLKCQAKVGGYSWKGSRCSCGKWMIPAMNLQVSKVDKVLIKRK
ncbi:unnamed protein product [Ambrosiozyma monospora]|uniref:Unnamed protein product n=1 Tax=Ambrosiozyma monospora TaxID=43982 RepID=A0ACB5T4L3_AMBMO|nr:unnamed protein product [Ambrosiozyma monospora]